MIDRQKRDQAASLVRHFLRGDITSDQLESGWPSNNEDRALEAVSSMVWLHYDDLRPRRLIGRDAASPEEAALLRRYAAFLDTDLPYDWPASDSMRISGLGSLVPFSLGLLKPLDRRIKARNEEFEAAMDAHGDMTVWPFTRREDWADEPLPPYDR